ncbi:ESX secretion-associated protein EspG [Nocardia sp. NPDC058666]|uniref:ESX secretion-associated protein EspG n=1 Tax=unclassified Nocardia TaxID=2637762 RepID=UPI00366047FC
MTARTSLDLSADEFAWLWRTVADGDEFGFPDPLRIQETATTVAEYTLQTRAFGQRFATPAIAALRPVFETLARPTSRIRCFGTTSNGYEIRTHAAIDERVAVILHQQPGPREHSGPIRLVLADPFAAAAHVVATMPSAEPGGAGSMLGYTPRVRGDEPPTSWGRTGDGRLPVDERIRKLARIPRSAEGQLIIERDLTSNRPWPPHYLSWIDIPSGQFASGRYLVEVRNHETIVTAASTARIAQELRRHAGLRSDNQRRSVS